MFYNYKIYLFQDLNNIYLKIYYLYSIVEKEKYKCKFSHPGSWDF